MSRRSTQLSLVGFAISLAVTNAGFAQYGWVMPAKPVRHQNVPTMGTPPMMQAAVPMQTVPQSPLYSPGFPQGPQVQRMPNQPLPAAMNGVGYPASTHSYAGQQMVIPQRQMMPSAPIPGQAGTMMPGTMVPMGYGQVMRPSPVPQANPYAAQPTPATANPTPAQAGELHTPGAGLPNGPLVSLLREATALEKEGKLEEAIDRYRQAQTIAPNNWHTMVSHARLLHRKGEMEAASALYEQVHERYPGDAVALNDHGLLLARQGQLENAKTKLTRAVSLQPDSKRYRNNLATVLIETGEINEALTHLQEVHGEAIGEYNMGYLLARRGRTDMASEHLRVALHLDPSLAPARELLASFSNQIPQRVAAKPESASEIRLQSGSLPPGASPTSELTYHQPIDGPDADSTSNPVTESGRTTPPSIETPGPVPGPSVVPRGQTDTPISDPTAGNGSLDAAGAIPCNITRPFFRADKDAGQRPDCDEADNRINSRTAPLPAEYAIPGIKR